MIEDSKHFLAYLLEELNNILYLLHVFFFHLQYRLSVGREGTHACNFVAVFMGQLLQGTFPASLTLNVTYKREESLDTMCSPHWEKEKTKCVLFLSF